MSNRALARSPSVPLKEAPAGPPKPGQHDNEESCSKIQGAQEKSDMAFCEMPGGLARRHDGRLPVEGDLRQEPGTT